MDFNITNRYNLNIVGKIEGLKNKNLAFVVHGLSGDMSQPHIQTMIKALVSADYQVIAFDCTHSFGKSDGEYETVTLTSYLQDLQDVITWASKQEWYKEPFLLAGHSMGGYTVTRFAELYPSLVDRLIAFAPVISGQSWSEIQERKFPEVFSKWQEVGFIEEPSVGRPGIIKRLLWDPHVVDRKNHNLIPDAGKVSASFLDIVGSADDSCPVYLQEKLLAAVGSAEKELVIINDAPHTFRDEKDLLKLHNTIYNWVGK